MVVFHVCFFVSHLQKQLFSFENLKEHLCRSLSEKDFKELRKYYKIDEDEQTFLQGNESNDQLFEILKQELINPDCTQRLQDACKHLGETLTSELKKQLQAYQSHSGILQIPAELLLHSNHCHCPDGSFSGVCMYLFASSTHGDLETSGKHLAGIASHVAKINDQIAMQMECFISLLYMYATKGLPKKFENCYPNFQI